MTFAVTVLGSSAMYATVERACSGYLLDTGRARVWLDAGAGTWRNLLQYVDYRQLGGIVLTHRHPDHVSDVFQIFHARQFGGPEPMDRIPIWAPAETIERVTGYYREFGDGFDVQAIRDGDSVEACGARFSFVKMAHPPETVGVRVEVDGTVLAYTADTGPDADFDRLAHDADLLVAEATYQDADEHWEGHLSASQAGKVAAQVGARSLLLTHLPPGRDLGLSIAEAQAAAGGATVRLAADGMRLELQR